MEKCTWLFGTALALALGAPVSAAEEDPYEDWFLEGAESNLGELDFLSEPPDYEVHHHKNEFTLDDKSLEEGWVQMRQCHDNLDEIRKIAIVFQEERSRNIQVASYTEDKIGGAEVDEHRVILSDVVDGARICIEAESKLLEQQADGTYSLQNGPFMRRFMDSYHPMQVTLDIDHSEAELDFESIHPEAQPGFDVKRDGRQLAVEAWFEGRLETEIKFSKR